MEIHTFLLLAPKRTFWSEVWFQTSKFIHKKMVIYRYKSPFNFIFEPEFSTGSPVGDPGGARTHDTKLKSFRLKIAYSSEIIEVRWYLLRANMWSDTLI